MAEMGTYCKAYPIERFREFSGWSENAQNARKEKGNGQETEQIKDLTGHLYLQENFTVTDGIFLDQNIIFDQVTSEWVSFCKETLQFAVPEYDSAGENGQREPTGEAPAGENQ
jgi:hypothetical protein